jgi:alkanesulfonate monooxygenase SsuD/methylene tetrahydromethanopterin reductase-like flavin-dependent oxidoreductase (luciferase family)
MDIGISLPNAVPGTDGAALIEFARRADQAGFSSLGTIDRLVYPNYEPLVALAAAASVTERIALATSILITPYRPNTALLAKQAATIDVLSGGRLWLGVGIGARADDYEASGLSTKGRGTVINRQLEDMKSIWAGEDYRGAGPIGPPPVSRGGPELIIGGGSDIAYRRAARYGDGWIAGAGAPGQFAEGREKAERAWADAGRRGGPKTKGLTYFSLGDRAEENLQHSVKHYYAWLGEEIADMIAGSAATSPEMVKSYVDGFEQAGCGEVIFCTSASDPQQVDLLAQAVGKA